ncbi:MAG: type IV pilus modification protein PilV [Pseudomonadota bacterium]
MTKNITMQRVPCKSHKAKGFTMIEVLVAIVVLSIGLLGLAGLQATGLRNNQSAYLRTIATQQAYDMADRIRANPNGVLAGQYDNISTAIPATPPADCVTHSCTASDMAAYDAYAWKTATANLLPSGKSAVSRPAGGTRFTITVMWDDARNGATGTGCDPNNPNDLTCFSMSFQP